MSDERVVENAARRGRPDRPRPSPKSGGRPSEDQFPYEFGDLAEDDGEQFPIGEYEFARDDEEREAITNRWLRSRRW
jgi:hypothetical protein